MRSIITATLILLCLFSQAQEKKITLDLNVGYVNSSFKLNNTRDFKSSTRSSFNAGFSISRHFTEKFSLQSGLFLVGKGGKLSYTGNPVEQEEEEEEEQPPREVFQPRALKTIGLAPVTENYLHKSMYGIKSISSLASVITLVENPESQVSAKIEASIRYIEIPLNAIYTLNTNSGQIQIGAGPYYALAISGKLKSAITSIGEGSHTVNTSKKIKFGNLDDDDFRRHDFGLNFLAGFRFNNKIFIKAGYGLGLADISTHSSESSIKNRLFQVGLGYSLK